MKLEKGMYVKTECGISKIVNIIVEKTGTFIETDNGLGNCNMSTRGKLHKGIYIFEEDYKTFIENNVKNAIIDLIEVGDYVNGLQVIEVREHLHNDIEIILTNGSFSWSFSKNESDYKIKSIVTKEQFESMSYKVC